MTFKHWRKLFIWQQFCCCCESLRSLATTQLSLAIVQVLSSAFRATTVSHKCLTLMDCELTEQGCRQLSENERRLYIQRTNHPFSTFSASASAAKATSYHSKMQASASNTSKLFSTFSSLLNPPTPPFSLSADGFVNHFEKRFDDIRCSFTKPIIDMIPGQVSMAAKSQWPSICLFLFSKCHGHVLHKKPATDIHTLNFTSHCSLYNKILHRIANSYL